MLMLSLIAFLPLPQIVTSTQNLGPTAPQEPIIQTAPWAMTFGGGDVDWFADAVPDGRNGLFLAGSTYSFGAGLDDGWVARVTARGRPRWEIALGGTGADALRSVAATPDGGCIVAGSTTSSGAGGTDGWVVKLGPQGKVQWERTFGSVREESFESVVVATHAGTTAYYLGGMADSAVSGRDAWVLALDASGGTLWQNLYGGKGNEDLTVLISTPDGPVFVANSSSSLGGPAVTFFRPWIVRLDSSGLPFAQRTYNFTDGELLHDLIALPDGTFATTGEITATSFARGDVWVQHLDAGLNVLWNRALGDNFSTQWVDSGRQLCATPKGGLLIFGSTGTAGAGSEDMWLLHLDSAGGLISDRTIGGGGFDNGLGIVFDPDGLAFVGGRLQPDPGGGPFDIYLARLRPEVLLEPAGTTCPAALTTQPNLWTPPLQVNTPGVLPTPAALPSLRASSAVTALDSRQILCR